MHCLHNVAQVRFTPEEWDLLDRLAGARRITIEQLIREELRLAPLDEGASRESAKRHLRLVRAQT
jgi:GAF domain-containing protein